MASYVCHLGIHFNCHRRVSHECLFVSVFDNITVYGIIIICIICKILIPIIVTLPYLIMIIIVNDCRFAEANAWSQVYGLLLLPVAIAFCVYSLYTYMRRADMIRKKLPGPCTFYTHVILLIQLHTC